MRLLAIVLLGLYALCAQAAGVYKWTDERGVVHYTEQPPPGQRAAPVAGVQGRADPRLAALCTRLRGLVPGLLTGMRSAQTRSAALAEAGVADRQLQELGMSDANLRKLVELLYGFNDPAASGARLAGGEYHATRSAWTELQRAQQEVYSRCLSGAFGTFDQPVRSAAAPRAGTSSSGTGFFVAAGLVATSWHVVKDGSTLQVTFDDGSSAHAELLVYDEHNDLAVLSVLSAAPHQVLATASAEAGLGSGVFTVGFPQIEIMGTRPKLATGVISALSGIQDDERTYQISVPVQSGNSGGPLVNERGEVVGVVAAKLNAAQVFRWTGDLPQNVNYAVKSTHLVALLGKVEMARAPVATVAGSGVEMLAPQVQAAVVRITAR